MNRYYFKSKPIQKLLLHIKLLRVNWENKLDVIFLYVMLAKCEPFCMIILQVELLGMVL